MIGDRCLRVAHHAFILFVVVATTVVLSAQTVVDPRFVEFSPSANHNTNDSDGTPLVQRYSLSVYPVGSSAAFDTMDLGKPTPSGGVIRVDFLPLLHSVPTPGVMFEARVTAIGPGGSTTSSLSNTFSFQAACTYTLSPGSQAVAAAGTSGNVSVAAGASCSWSAVSNNSGWLTVTSGASGSGNGTVGFSVAANTGAARSGTVAIGGQTFTVNQAAPCTYTLSPGSQAVAAAGTSGNVSVAAGASCSWSAVSNNSGWLTVTSGASGSGNGTVGFSVAANTGAARSGTVAIGGRTFTVNQAAAPCTYTLSPGSQAVAAAGTSGNVGVAAGAGCNWSATSNAGWITLTGTASGSGNGTVGFSVAANTGAARSGTVAIGGRTFTVNQAAAPCTYTLSPGSQAVAVAGTSGNVSVVAGAGCNWSATSSAGWITLTGTTNGTGNGSVPYSVAANTGAARSGTVAIGGQTFTVNQAAPCTYTLSPGSQAVAVAGTSGNVSVVAGAGCSWSAVSNNTGWLTVTSGASGSGNGTVGFSVAANTGAARSGTVAIGGQTFTVNQAAPCTYTLSPGSQAVAVAGTSGNVSVVAGAGCSWSAVSNNTGWLTVTSGASGSGNGTVGFSVAANTGAARSGTVAIGGQTFTVNQAAPCTYTLSPGSQAVAVAGTSGNVSVVAGAGCSWSAVSNNTGWLTVTSGASGSGNGTVGFSVAANTGAARSGTVAIGGRTFTVNQAAAAPCTYTLSPGSQAVAVAGTSGNVGVAAGASCSWSAVSNNSGWLTVTSGASGSGNGTVGFSVAANTGAARSGTVAIGGQTFTVNQNGASCAFSISPTSLEHAPFDGANGSSTVTTSDGCAWTATSDTSWITVTSGAQGTTSGQVTFTVAPNTEPSQRLGSLTIAGRTFAVTQVGDTCNYVLTPPSQSIAAGSATGSTAVAAPAGCSWSGVSNNTGWLTVTSGASGTGDGSVTFSASANTSSNPRTGTLTVGGQTFTVTQAAAGCTFAISSNSVSVVAAGATGSTTVTSGAGCAWSAASNDSWITVTSGASGSGNGTVGFSVAANTGVARTGTLTIATRTFTVSQAASACSYSLTPTSRAVGSAGANTTTNVTTAPGCGWTAVSNATAWLAITGGASGSGNGTVSFSTNTNTTTQVRVGTATIAGKTFTVTQNAASCTFTIAPTSMQLAPFVGANGSSTVTTSNGCAWTATSNTPWITVTSGAQGTTSGQVTFTVAPSTVTSQRLGSLTIATRTFAVTQVGNSCNYVLTPASRTIVGEGETGSITVGTASGCPWTATTSQSWISVSGNGTASGSASYAVSANTTGTSRVGSISIGTKSFTITQGVPTGSASAPVVPTGSAPMAPSGLRVKVTGSEKQ